MFDKDKAMKQLFRHNEVVAGTLNYVLASNEEYFQPSWFRDGNPNELAVVSDLLGIKKTKERHRDACRILAWESDGQRNYLFLGIEHQSAIDPFMALRVAMLDVMNYDAQRELFLAGYPKFPWKDGLRKEVLSQMRAGSVLHPVLTIVVYTGKEPWDAPCSLREMVPVGYPLVESDVPDFRMRLLSLREIPEKNLPHCEKNLRTVVKYLKYEDDPEGLAELLDSDADFKDVPVDAARVIEAITETEIEIPEQQEKVDMCKAQRELLKRQWEAGQLDGRKAGFQDGHEAGFQDGRNAEKLHGIQVFIATAKIANMPSGQIQDFLVRMYGLTQQEAAGYLQETI